MPAKEQVRSEGRKTAVRRTAQPTVQNSDVQAQQMHPTATIQRARLDPSSLTPRDVLQLQCTLGNQLTRRVVEHAASWHLADTNPVQKLTPKEARTRVARPGRANHPRLSALESLQRMAADRPNLQIGALLLGNGSNIVQMAMKRQREEQELPEERRSKRRRMVSLSELPLHFKKPTYELESPRSGGKCSTAVLGPNSLYGMGTDANPRLPRAIDRARKEYPHAKFVAGHLLNADFGGTGRHPKNLTILTASANARMKGFDNRIKTAVEQLESLYKLLSRKFIDIKPLRYGIKVTISVSKDKWGSIPPDNYIANSVSCRASVSGALNLSQTPEDIHGVMTRIRTIVAEANTAGRYIKNSVNI
jgi:hypothetical protein